MKIKHFDFPAGLRDLHGIRHARDAWSRTVSNIIQVMVDALETKQFYDPCSGSATTEKDEITREIIWSAFPQQLVGAYGLRRALEIADEASGYGTLGITASGTPIRSKYRNQTEYCEWHVDRDAAGRITRVTFTTEFLEYWWVMAQGYPPPGFQTPSAPRPHVDVSMARIQSYFRKWVDPKQREKISIADLTFRDYIVSFDKSDRAITQFAAGDYNPWNRWHDPSDGALVHLTMPGNALGALLQQCVACTIPHSDKVKGRPFRNPVRAIASAGPGNGDGIQKAADLAIGGVIGPLARAGAEITLGPAPAVLMKQLDTRGWKTRDGTDPQTFWKTIRGENGVVRAEYSVPSDLGYTVSDVLIDGAPIRYGGQIAQHIALGFTIKAQGFGKHLQTSRKPRGEAVITSTGALSCVNSKEAKDRRYQRLFPLATPLRRDRVGGWKEPTLDDREIQGNTLVGFNKDHQWFIGLDIVDKSLARAWLRKQAGRKILANTQQAATDRANHKAGLQVRTTWFNIAFSYAGLIALGVAGANEFTSSAFRDGMWGRGLFTARVSGKKVRRTREPHVLLIIASDWDPAVVQTHGLGEVLGTRNQLAKEARANGFEMVEFHAGRNPAKKMSGREPFGFKDGISQPAVRGRLSSGKKLIERVVWATPASARYVDRNEPEYAEPGRMLVWPGEFVLGYERQNPHHPAAPIPPAECSPAWSRNGSFIVFARFRQDVTGFKRHVAALARNSGRGVDYEMARIVGRWPTGAPVVAGNKKIPQLDADPQNNHFLFQETIPKAAVGGVSFGPIDGDPGGKRCPFTAHIRKVNPRDEAAEDGTLAGSLRRRIIRRGIPYDDRHKKKREQGLLFLCYQASIEGQFEFIWKNWVNSGISPAGGGVDALIAEDSPFVELRRGGYYFAPSISALREL